MILLGPRREAEAPFVSWLPRPGWHAVFGREELLRLCEQAGLKIEGLFGLVGRLGTVAKQMEHLSRGRLLPLGLYPLQCGLTMLDACTQDRKDRRSLMWLLIARRNEMREVGEKA